MRILSSLSIILIANLLLISQAYADKSPVYDQVFTLIKQKKWPEAENLAKKTGNSALQKIVLSQEFQDNDYKNNSFERTIKFIKENPHWPSAKTIRLKAESYIKDNTDKQKIVDFFAKEAPGTAKGHKYYALAAAEKLQNPATMIKKGWILGNFTKAEEDSFYRKFKKYLSEEDNAKKIDSHLWAERNTSARSLYHLVSSGYRKSFEAQIAFMEKKQKAASLFASVDEKYYTPGLIYEYLNSIKSSPPESKKIVALFRMIKEDGGRSEDFWKLQTYIIREYIEQHKFRDAYNIAEFHCAKSPAHLSEAEFLSGWLALRFLKDPNLAISHFTKMKNVVKSPISLARSLYWLGRSYAAAGNTEKSMEIYRLAASNYGYSFYGQLAGVELGDKTISFPKVSLKDHKDNGYAKNNDLVKAMNIVLNYGTPGLSRTYIDAVVNQTSNSDQVYSVMLNLNSNKNITHYRAWLAKSAIQKHVFVSQYAYPTPYNLTNLPLEEPLVYSIIRQESVFDQYAISSANAMGLMQLIRGTAHEVSRVVGVHFSQDKLTSDPKYNILLGSHYLNHLIKKFDGSYILAIAAYNGGKVGKWIDLHGDPRKFTDKHKVIDWMEMMPFAETRNYVQRVLENAQIYNSILGKTNKNVMLHYMMPNK